MWCLNEGDTPTYMENLPMPRRGSWAKEEEAPSQRAIRAVSQGLGLWISIIVPWVSHGFPIKPSI